MKRFWLIFAVGVLLFLPSLRGGFLLDDFYYLGAVEGRYPEHDTARSLFTFFVGDPEATARLAAEGTYPWWIDETIRSRLLRPLPDLLLRADHALWGRNPLGYHLHSLLWWAATLSACGLVFRRALPGAVGLLAFLLFALDDSHTMPVAWIANRNALVAAAAVMFGLWAWIRWREDRWTAGRILAPACFLVGLAGGELALAALAYVLAYELWGAPAGSGRVRRPGLVWLVVLGIAYVLVYRGLGYGGSGSGLYLHPLEDPLGFLSGALTRVPTLIGAAVTGFSADLWFAAPQLRSAQVAVGCGAALALGFVLRGFWSGLDEQTRRTLRWLLVGSALSLLPVAATFPSDRMLLVPGLGIAAALSVVLLRARSWWRGRRRRPAALVIGLLAIGHLVLAPAIALHLQSMLATQSAASLDLAASDEVAACAGKEAILVAAPDHIVGLYLPLLIEHQGLPMPRSWRVLSLARCDQTLRRAGPRTLELETAPGEAMMNSAFETLYRGPDRPLRPGAVLDRGLFRAEIQAANGQGPTRVAFHFDRDLDDPQLCFLVWRDGRLVELDADDWENPLSILRTLGPAGF